MVVSGLKTEPTKPAPATPTIVLITFLRIFSLCSQSRDGPVYIFNTTLTRDIIEEDPESEDCALCNVPKQKRLPQLEVKVSSGFSTLVSSQKELEKLTSEVECEIIEARSVTNWLRR